MEEAVCDIIQRAFHRETGEPSAFVITNLQPGWEEGMGRLTLPDGREYSITFARSI